MQNDKVESGLLHRLERPALPVDLVLDTDTYNEIDDQYALAYLIRLRDRLNLKAIYAAPFFNEKSVSPADGMEKSYEEIRRVLRLMDREEMMGIALKGSESFLPDERTPVDSPAARDLARRAMDYTPEKPLYVVAIAAITNVASAILMNPAIVDRIVIVWLGGNAVNWPTNREFNLRQDVAAARVAFGCGAALVQLPCMGVVSAFTSSGPELEYHLRGKNRLCDYLVDVTQKEALACGGGKAWTRPIWDVTAVAWLLGEEFMLDSLEHAPVPEYDDRYAFDRTRHLYRYVYHINRDRLFEDLFEKLGR